MVIGKGDIASVLTPRKDLVYLASGLSNSSKVMYCDFVRERNLISMYQNNHVVYFSTLSIYYNDNDYTRYKLELESYVKETCKSYTIVRLGNIDWGTNPNTILNYFRNNPNAEVQEGHRFLITKDEFLFWMDKIRVGQNDIMNLTGTKLTIKQIYEKAIHTNK